MKRNVLDEVTSPEKKPRETAVWNPHKITRNVNTKQLETETEIKRYKLVFDKRVVDATSFFSYPYGYAERDLEEEDMDRLLRDQSNVENLLSLVL